MANTVVVQVTVQELTKYGFKANDKYVNFSKNLSETDKSVVVPGAVFEAEFYVSDGGKEYLNKVLSKPFKTVKEPETEKAQPSETKTFKPKYQKEKAMDNSMSKEEWAAKDQRISRQGVIQAAVQALSGVVSLEDLPHQSEKLADFMLKFVNQR